MVNTDITPLSVIYIAILTTVLMVLLTITIRCLDSMQRCETWAVTDYSLANVVTTDSILFLSPERKFCLFSYMPCCYWAIWKQVLSCVKIYRMVLFICTDNVPSVLDIAFISTTSYSMLSTTNLLMHTPTKPLHPRTS